MLIATFGPATEWAGRKVTYEDGAYVLVGHGAISAADIMEYDRLGYLLWVTDGTRAWVGSKAVGPTASAAPAGKATSAKGVGGDSTEGLVDQRTSRGRSRLRRALLITIGALILTNVLLLLTLLGVFRGL